MFLHQTILKLIKAVYFHHGPYRTAYHTKDPLYGPYHKGEWPGWQGSVIVDAVSHTHLNLSFLDPVAGSVVQKTHYSMDGKLKGEKERASGCFCFSQFFTFLSLFC